MLLFFFFFFFLVLLFSFLLLFYSTISYSTKWYLKNSIFHKHHDQINVGIEIFFYHRLIEEKERKYVPDLFGTTKIHHWLELFCLVTHGSNQFPELRIASTIRELYVVS